MLTACAISAHLGGSISDAAAVVRWAQASRCEVRIEGECASACTMLLRVGCVMPDARLGFHAPNDHGKQLSEAGRAQWAGVMAGHLPPALARWYLDGPARLDHGCRCHQGRRAAMLSLLIFPCCVVLWLVVCDWLGWVRDEPEMDC